MGYSGQDRRVHSNPYDYFNNLFPNDLRVLEPGEAVFSAQDDQMIATSVGSGIVVSFYDPGKHHMAAGYVVLPPEVLDKFPYLNNVSPDIIHAAFKPIEKALEMALAKGSSKGQLAIRVTGGTDFPGQEGEEGSKNLIFVREYMARKGLSVLSEECGGPYVRRIYIFPESGRVVRHLLRRQDDYERIAASEQL